MSDKKRQKKDGGRKDKQNKAMHEAENDRALQQDTPMQSRDQSNRTESEPGAADANHPTRQS